MTSFPVKCKHITSSFPYKVKVKGQRSKVGFDPEPLPTHLLTFPWRVAGTRSSDPLKGGSWCRRVWSTLHAFLRPTLLATGPVSQPRCVPLSGGLQDMRQVWTNAEQSSDQGPKRTWSSRWQCLEKCTRSFVRCIFGADLLVIVVIHTEDFLLEENVENWLHIGNVFSKLGAMLTKDVAMMLLHHNCFDVMIQNFPSRASYILAISAERIIGDKMFVSVPPPPPEQSTKARASQGCS